MADNSPLLPTLLTELYQLSLSNEELWKPLGQNAFRATLASGTIEISGSPTPYGLRSAIEQSWAGRTGTFLWDWLTVPLKPVLLLAASKSQSTYKWPDRKLKIDSVNGTTNEFFVDYENPIYNQVSQLLLIAELAAQTSDLPDTVKEMSDEIAKLLTPATSVQETEPSGEPEPPIAPDLKS